MANVMFGRKNIQKAMKIGFNVRFARNGHTKPVGLKIFFAHYDTKKYNNK